MAKAGLLERFIGTRPFSVMTRCILDEMMSTELDVVFEENRSRQYQREVLFSQMANTMAEVVLGFCESPNQAYKSYRDELNVSSTAFYNKLNRIETTTTEAFVRHAATKAGRFLDALGYQPWEWIEGYRCRAIDGNHLQASENRLEELRGTWAAPLPGTVVAMLDMQTELIDNVFLIEDGHAQERTILDDVLNAIEPMDLIIGDRHYCTIAFLTGIAGRRGFFAIRQHGTLKGQLVGKRKYRGRSETGKVFEQAMVIGKTATQPGLYVRRITVELHEPTRDGDTEIHILANVPRSDATAIKLSDLYRARWEIERVFNIVTMSFTCEVKGLGHPLAALFVFCTAIAAYNASRVMMTALMSVHGDEVADELSHYSMAQEIRKGLDGFVVAIPEDEWRALIPSTIRGKASFLRRVASHVDLDRHRKSRRGPKKPPPDKKPYKNGSHVSTAKVLKERLERC
jgi:hypothetical protein